MRGNGFRLRHLRHGGGLHFAEQLLELVLDLTCVLRDLLVDRDLRERSALYGTLDDLSPFRHILAPHRRAVFLRIRPYEETVFLFAYLLRHVLSEGEADLVGCHLVTNREAPSLSNALPAHPKVLDRTAALRNKKTAVGVRPLRMLHICPGRKHELQGDIAPGKPRNHHTVLNLPCQLDRHLTDKA